MAMASEYVRCTVKCGAFRVKDVRLPADALAEATSGNDKARKQIVNNFIVHIKVLGVIRNTEIADQISYDSLEITYSIDPNENF